MEFAVLGPLQVSGSHQPELIGRPSLRSLLAMLLCRPNELLAADVLIDELWCGRVPVTPKRALQVHMHRLRRALGGDRVLHEHGGYRLRVEPGELDCDQFERLTDDAAVALSAGDTGRGVVLLRDALALWRGEAFAGLTAESAMLDLAAQRLADRRVDAVEQLMTVRLRLGQAVGVAAELRGLVSEYPMRENLHALLITALYRCGDTAAALAAYRAARDWLGEELGVDPGPPLRRLEHDILAGVDPSLVGLSRAVPAQLPRDQASLAGRDAELRLLDELVASNRPVVITGIAGVGKTALALAWANQHRDRYPDGQLYVDLRGYASTPARSASGVLAGFLRAFGLSSGDLPSSTDGLAAMFRSTLAGRKVLVLLDNVADAAVVRQLLPPSGGPHVLITSRAEPRGLVVTDDARVLPLDVLPAASSARLLAGALGQRRVRDEAEAVAELAGLCGGLPLALRIAAAHLVGRPRQSIADYVGQLRLGDPLAELAVPGDPDATLRSAFDLSYAALSADARVLFRRVGLLKGPDFTERIAACLAGYESGRVRRLLDQLVAANLLTEHRPGRYRPHDLVRWYCAARCAAQDTGADRGQAVSRVLGYYLASGARASYLVFGQTPGATGPSVADTPPEPFAGRADAVEWLTAEYDNLLALVLGYREHPLCWRLVGALHHVLDSSGDRASMAAAAAAGLASARAGGSALGQASMQRTLAVAAVRTGELDAAIEHAEQAFAVGDRLFQAWAATVLAHLCWYVGELGAGVDYAIQGLSRYRELGRPGGQVSSLCRLAVLYASRGELDRAQARATEARRIARPGHLLQRAAAHSTLAQIAGDRGDHETALRHARAAIELDLRLGDRALVALEQVSLGRALTGLGRLTEASEMLNRALTATSQVHYLEARLLALLRYAELCLRDRRRADAVRYATEVRTEAARRGYRLFEADARTLLAAAATEPPIRQAEHLSSDGVVASACDAIAHGQRSPRATASTDNTST